MSKMISKAVSDDTGILENMRYIKGERATAVNAIADRICKELTAKKRVVWLVSGGSNIPVEVEVMSVLQEKCGEYLQGLAILPIDERFGSPGHKDSNTQQLRDAGFNPGTAIWIDVLVGDRSFEGTTTFYNQAVTVAFANADIIIGQIGMGTDGHIVGILPDSPASTNKETINVVGYLWTDYSRMTLSIHALKSISVAYALIFGEDKQQKVRQLFDSDDSDSVKFPAELLKRIPEVYIYNDSINSKEG